MLAEVQRGLERLYRVDTRLDVRDFVIDADARAKLAEGARGAREQLLVSERDGELELALFVDQAALTNLAARDPRHRLDDDNLQDFLLLVEGVSHFVYLAWRAQKAQPVSALELELQAEIDKYVTCVLMRLAQDGEAGELLPRLFERFQLAPDLDRDERERYLVANGNARTYAERLHTRYVKRGDVLAMLAELRWFWRLTVSDKLRWCGATDRR